MTTTHDLPLVSVIVPVYKTEQYLRECLSSICQQTYKNLEIIVVNDCSPDGSQDIIDDFARLDARIVACKTPSNSGLSICRNTGLKRASGAYVGFVDSDDVITLDNIEVFVRAIITNDCDMVMAPLYTYNEVSGAYYRDPY